MAQPRIKMLAGNWKMNKLICELESYVHSFMAAAGLDRDESLTERVDILFALPATMLAKAVASCEPHGLRIAAQNIHWEPHGAFTGEVSIPMVREVGVTAALIGHSERRQYFGETDEVVAKKVAAALAADMLPIVCVGESLAERLEEQTTAVVTRQIEAVLAVVSDPKDLIFAYEPVWAIGTGRTATSAQAQDVHALIRHLVKERLGSAAAAGLRILYGGSANPANISELLAQKDIDGALVGGASLKPQDFAHMVRAAL